MDGSGKLSLAPQICRVQAQHKLNFAAQVFSTPESSQARRVHAYPAMLHTNAREDGRKQTHLKNTCCCQVVLLVCRSTSQLSMSLESLGQTLRAQCMAPAPGGLQNHMLDL